MMCGSQHQIWLLRLQIFLRALEYRALELWALTLVLTHVLEHQKSETSRARIAAFPFSSLLRANGVLFEFEAGKAC